MSHHYRHQKHARRERRAEYTQEEFVDNFESISGAGMPSAVQPPIDYGETPAPMPGVRQAMGEGVNRLLHKLGNMLPVVTRSEDDQADLARQMPAISRGGAPIAALGSLLNSLNWDNVRAEVDQEARGRIVIAGAPGSGKSTLLNALKNATVSAVEAACATAQADVKLEDLGLFSLVTIVPAHFEASDLGESILIDQAWQSMLSADVVIWMLDGRAGLRAWEHEWICRLRGTGKPMLVVMNMRDGCGGSERDAHFERTLGCTVLAFDAKDAAQAVSVLLPKVVQTCDKLNVALGREVSAWREQAAQHVIVRATAISGLVGAEPIPLLDIPYQVTVQLRTMLRLAAIYGEPTGDRYSREMLATMITSVGLRIAGQQLTKMVPYVGWLCSGAFAAGGTWLMGKAVQQYFAMGRAIPVPRLTIRLELRRSKGRAEDAQGRQS